MINNLIITVLCENNSQRSDLEAEHGFSLFIEADNKKYLFDTGASDKYLKNAKTLGIDITNINKVILSHSHYDHTGGLELLDDKTVFVHQHFFNKKYKKINDRHEYIGIKLDETEYELGNRIKFLKLCTFFVLDDSTRLVCDFSKQNNQNDFYIKINDRFQPDYFNDEIIVTFNTKKGLVILTGCSHSGIINIINKAIEINKTDKIYTLLGGLHLSKLSEGENKSIAGKLNRYKIANIGISHCTGDKLLKYLSPGTAFNFNTGDKFEI
ncbi:MAG: MBL fold metallo-hydrolase [Candidatus Margulisbacteria bacterium]|nr:MBL fold metallo-hydrolase [Candidatus Margulisiibacteriota bacterium]